MRGALRPLIRRLAAYAVDVLILAAVLIPAAFGIQALIGYRPETGIGVWLASLVTISVPSWAYFTAFDASSSGATLGKRLLGLRVATVDGARLGTSSAFVRTAIKLIPWELTHAAMFALAPRLGDFGAVQVWLLGLVYALFAIYVFVTLRNSGERSVHDLVAGSVVRRRAA